MLDGMPTGRDPYYRPALARAHHLGYGFHAGNCAPGILALLAPVRARGGLVLELGSGSGLLTRHLTDAGHRVIATDGYWRRDDERHDNVLIDTAQVPGMLAAEGIEVTVGTAFGGEQLPPGLAVLIGRRAA